MEEGILARPQDVQVGAMPGLDRDRPIHQHWVAVAFKDDLEHANALLDEYVASPPVDEAEWAHEAEPDLTLLPPDLVIPCVRCKHDLRDLVRSSGVVRCVSCGTENDPVQRVVARHGPEALLGCYPDDEPEDPDWSEEAVIRRLHLPCPHCQCPLHALDLVGDCPACGGAYNKRAIVRHAFEAM